MNADAQEVYRAMLADRSKTLADLATSLGLTQERVRKALDELADSALLQPDVESPLAVAPSNPRIGMAKMVSLAEMDLAAQAERVSAMRALMESMAAEHDSRIHRESLLHHTTLDAVRSRMEALAVQAENECVSLNPGRAHRPDAMAASKPLNQQALERGVAIRAVYQDSFRHDPATLGYARWLTGIGGATRTMPVVPRLLVIVDRKVALIPRIIDEPEKGAVEVHNPSIVAALVEHFEMVWSISEPFGGDPSRQAPVTSATSSQLLHMLSAGATDEAAARRLGLSARTVRRIMSAYMTDVQAESRFQAGVEAVRRGLLD